MLSFLFRQRWRQVKRYITEAGPGRALTVFLMGVVGLFVAFGVYGLLEFGLSAVQDNAFLREALPFFIYEMFLLVVSGLVFYSVLISGLFSLFRSEEDFWVVASPSFSRLVYDKFIAVSSLSLWPVVIIAVPALIAIESVFSLGFNGLIIGLFAVMLLAIVSAAIGFCVLLAVSRLFRAICGWADLSARFRWLASLVGLLITVSALTLWYLFGGIDIAELFAVRDLELAQASIGQITDLFVYFPSHLAALVLQSLQADMLRQAVISFSSLLVTTILSLLIISYLSRGYIDSWKFFQNSGSVAGFNGDSKLEANVEQVYFSDNATVSLIKKEALMFIRDTQNQLWALFLVLLWFITVAFDAFMKSKLTDESFLGVSALEFIQTFQLLVVAYFVAALSVRFVFPSFSLEKDRAWSLMSAPVSLVRLFVSKAVFFAGSLGLVAGVISGIHMLLLGVEGFSVLLFIGLAVLASMTVAVVGLALGARFPNFRTSNPDVLATTLPGLSFVLISLVYGSLASYTLYQVFLSNQLLPIIWFVVLSFLLAYVCCYVAVRKLPHIEFEEQL
jgi:ABC-2 type transport system permease protein